MKNDVLVKKFEDVANKLAEQLANETNPTLKTQIAAALAAAKKERDDAVLAKMKAEATVAALATQ